MAQTNFSARLSHWHIIFCLASYGTSCSTSFSAQLSRWRIILSLTCMASHPPAGDPVPESGYELTPKSLTLLQPPAGPFELEVTTAIKPQDNSLLEGLYKSGGNYCTQVNSSGNVAFHVIAVDAALTWVNGASTAHR
jgi:hypothetical protein